VNATANNGSGAMDDMSQCFHVGEYLQDELDARGWTAGDLAGRMGTAEEFDENYLVVEMMLHCWDVGLMLDEETAAKLSMALGSDAATWLSLDREWRRCKTQAN
jgi:plasmid maintenance system antidote protein VapI